MHPFGRARRQPVGIGGPGLPPPLGDVVAVGGDPGGHRRPVDGLHEPGVELDLVLLAAVHPVDLRGDVAPVDDDQLGPAGHQARPAVTTSPPRPTATSRARGA